jgi:ABC-2 type transport system ATP-binding protein
MRNPDDVVVAEGLCKRYGTTQALDGFDLRVARGTVCGLLGPNGAGKTTAVRILSTLLRFDSGRAEVAGYDVVRQASEVRYRLGLVGQHAAVDEILGGRQNLVMFGRLYHLGARQAAARADELLVQFGLADVGARPVKQYSGGMRRRLDLAASLVLSPPVLMLDEPTAGLDPRARAEVWAAVRTLVEMGTTVLLTTQYLDEADQLADAICVVDKGRVIAHGTPDQLKSLAGSDRIDVVLRLAAELPAAAALISDIVGTRAEIEVDTRRISAPVSDRMEALTGIVRALHDTRIAALDIALRRPTLDEVFLHLTGHAAGSTAAPAPAHEVMR